MDRLGDLVCSLPMLAALREAAPQATITIRSPTYLRELLEAQPCTDNWQKFDAPLTEPFDLAIDLSVDYVMEKSLLAHRAAAFQIGFNIAGRGAFLSHSLPSPSSSIHTVDKLGQLLTPLGLPFTDRIPKLNIRKTWQNKATAFLEAKGIDRQQPIVAVHPGGTYQTQRWAPERFAIIGQRLVTNMANPPLLLGGPAEENLCATIMTSAHHKPVNLCNQLNMGELAAILKSSNLLVANNSGPLHLACSVGTATLSTMGPTLPESWWPLGENHTVLRHSLPCSPCNEGYCRSGNHDCMRTISINQMWRSIQQKLTGERR